METLLYLAKVNAYWLLFYACYWLLLRKHTFFYWNRFYLLGTLVIAFALPAIHFAEPVSTIYVPEAVYQKATISVSVIASQTPETGIDLWRWVSVLYIAVALILAWKFVSSLFRLFKMASQGERIDMGNYSLVMLSESTGSRNGSSFSFFRWLFLSSHDYRHNPDTIIRHECEHIRQWHTADVLLIELLKIAFWINPVVWLYKRSIETVHEYLADRSVPNRNDYASFLVTYAMRSPGIAIANHFFNSSLLKRRIQMIYKKRSSKWLLAKYLMILPAVACSVAMSASRSPLQAIDQLKGEVEKTIRVRGLIIDEIDGAIEDATIIIAGTTRGTTSDRNGRFELQNVPANSKLVITHVAYETQEFKLTDNNQELGLIVKKAVNQITGPVIVGRPITGADTVAAVSSSSPPSGDMKIAEQRPSFPGGNEALMQYLLQNLQYPEAARKINVEAIALVSFTVDKNGDIRNAKSLKNIGYGIDKEALRVVNEMPKWNPALQNGKPVEMEYTLEVNFKLDKENQDKRQGFLDYKSDSFSPAPNMEQIDAFFKGKLNLSKWGKFTDIAVNGPWFVIPKTTSRGYVDERTGKQKFINYGGVYLNYPPSINGK
ncbi:TonB family protein [Dyadobacter sp. BE34]|uniref:TonB family protein n=1 Tax=Dyadobacter fermentans TaxID=94254 RepID=A0ABU1R2E5_9BACT|nr:MULTISPECIES: M56 family metallopeptidase [Dyadobacter]MDR6807555.1 TonB family protein [Dyadobacter fermentans]MDR7045296.1 TonB family protein [Dyadobacter sp. BE242]MDR7199609.1 TonB family protein [Dyadobacter sp. BE34]MDR7217932.1 TonB family protein [Dyadobacter sp. BE31]MDR7265500.1 TonB family protein [Dyadobacter sp. BE32]